MKRGLTLTLMTVAIALMSVRAMAVAPTITDLPSPIVGTAEFTTNEAKYVFPDAIDLNTFVVDDATADNDLKWSFDAFGANADFYKFNGKTRLPAGADPTSPDDQYVINSSVVSPEVNPDGLANTITIRNEHLNPLGTTTVNDGSIANGLVASETTVVTMYCSDGTSYSAKDMWLYTEKGGSDTYSPAKVQLSAKYMDNHARWKVSTLAWEFLNMTTAPLAGITNGVCLTVPSDTTNDHLGLWKSELGIIQMKANTVFRFRLTMNGSMTDPLTTPFYDFVIDNSGDGPNYGKGAFVYDLFRYTPHTMGGANGLVNSVGGTDATIYWAPPAVATTRWTTGFVSNTSIENDNDARLQMRILDLDASRGADPSLSFKQQSGTICLVAMVIEELPLDKMTVVNDTVYAANTMSRTQGATSGNVFVEYYGTVTVGFTSGVASIQPTGASRTSDLITVYPSTVDAPTGPSTLTPDKWPLPWESNTLYQLVVGMSAPNQQSMDLPVDAVYFVLECPSFELYSESATTCGMGISSAGMPSYSSAGTPQTYMAFLYTEKETAATEDALHFLRWKVRIANSSGVPYPNGQSLNEGGINIHSVKVRQVTW